MPAQSTAEAIGDAAEAALTALGLSIGGTALPIKRRKTPSLPEGASPPQIVISISDEQPTERISSAHKMRTVRFSVTIVTGGGAKAAEDATLQKWRELIDREIFDGQKSTFAGVKGFIHLAAFGGQLFDRQALPKDFNYTPLAYEAKASEVITAQI